MNPWRNPCTSHIIIIVIIVISPWLQNLGDVFNAWRLPWETDLSGHDQAMFIFKQFSGSKEITMTECPIEIYGVYDHWPCKESHAKSFISNGLMAWTRTFKANQLWNEVRLVGPPWWVQWQGITLYESLHPAPGWVGEARFSNLMSI